MFIGGIVGGFLRNLYLWEEVLGYPHIWIVGSEGFYGVFPKLSPVLGSYPQFNVSYPQKREEFLEITASNVGNPLDKTKGFNYNLC